MGNGQLQVRPVGPFLHIRTLHPLPLIHGIGEALQQSIIVIAKPAHRPRAQQVLDHGWRDLEFISRAFSR